MTTEPEPFPASASPHPANDQTAVHAAVQTALWDTAEHEGIRFTPGTLERLANAAVNAIAHNGEDLKRKIVDLKEELDRSRSETEVVRDYYETTRRNLRTPNGRATHIHAAAVMIDLDKVRDDLADAQESRQAWAIEADNQTQLVETLRRRLHDEEHNRHEIEQHLDRALGTRAEDGTGQGLAADVALLARRYTEVREQLARAYEHIGERALADMEGPTPPYGSAEQAAERVVDLDPPPADLDARALAAVKKAAQDNETAVLLRNAVAEIAELRANWVDNYVRRAQKGWRESPWTSAEIDRIEQEAVQKWNTNHPALITLWRHHEQRLDGAPTEEG